MSTVNCEACETLRQNASEFYMNGVTDNVCESLADDTGFNPKLNPQHTDDTDLHLANDCFIGQMQSEVNAFDVCDWKEFMEKYIGNDYEVNKGIICALGGVWKLLKNLIEALGGGDGKIPVIRRYRFTVPADAFGTVWRANNASKWVQVSEQWVPTDPDGIVEWFSGTGDNQHVGEMWIRVPITEMESITGVWTQTWVVPSGNPYDGVGKPFVQTVNVQEWFKENNYLRINFDTYIIAPIKDVQNGGPYPVTVDFLIVGSRTIL